MPDIFGPALLSAATRATSILWLLIGITALIMVVIMIGRLFPKKEH